MLQNEVHLVGILDMLGDAVHLVVHTPISSHSFPSTPLTLLTTSFLSLSSPLMETKYTSLIGILDMLGDEVHLVDWNSFHFCNAWRRVHLVDWNSCHA